MPSVQRTKIRRPLPDDPERRKPRRIEVRHLAQSVQFSPATNEQFSPGVDRRHGHVTPDLPATVKESGLRPALFCAPDDGIGLPVLLRASSCAHAIAITPAE